MNENEAIALVTFCLTGGAVAIALMILYYAARRLRNREIVAAFEHGRELPHGRRRGSRLGDVRSGVLLVTFSIGLGLFLWWVDAGDGAAVSLIPFFIGVGLLVNAVVERRFGTAGDDAGLPEGDAGDGTAELPDGGSTAGETPGTTSSRPATPPAPADPAEG